MQRALAILEYALPDHPTTASTQERLAALLRRMGRTVAASPAESASSTGTPGPLLDQPFA